MPQLCHEGRANFQGPVSVYLQRHGIYLKKMQTKKVHSAQN